MLYWKTTNRRVALLKFLELQTIHNENLKISGGTTYDIGRMGRKNESSECFQFATLANIKVDARTRKTSLMIANRND